MRSCTHGGAPSTGVPRSDAPTRALRTRWNPTVYGAVRVVRGEPRNGERRPLVVLKRLANLVIFHNTLDIADLVRELQAGGRPVDPLGLAQVSPYLTEQIKRFGEYSTHGLGIAPTTTTSAWTSTSASSVRRTRQQRDGQTGRDHTGQLPQDLVFRTPSRPRAD